MIWPPFDFLQITLLPCETSEKPVTKEGLTPHSSDWPAGALVSRVLPGFWWQLWAPAPTPIPSRRSHHLLPLQAAGDVSSIVCFFLVEATLREAWSARQTSSLGLFPKQ